MSKTREEWLDEMCEMTHGPNLDTPRKIERAKEMNARFLEIWRYLDGNGPEPGPWNPKHPATPEEKAQDLVETAERTARRWGVSADD